MPKHHRDVGLKVSTSNLCSEITLPTGKDHLGNDRYMVDTGRCFPYFARNKYCSICLPVCVYNHKEWARDFHGHQTKLFPNVLMPEPPLPYDGVPAEKKHYYPRRKRG